MENNMDFDFTLREYYNILSEMCDKLEENPDDDISIAAFTDAAYNLGKAKCHHLFPDDVLSVNASKTPADGSIVTAVKE